jgi:pimeloyl-ACP methyl ester carboxylesterase
LLLTHGWPGSIVEFHELIPLLTHPSAHGGEAQDAFTVVAPSIPGYGLSFRPYQRRFGLREIADTFERLMAEVLSSGTHLGAIIERDKEADGLLMSVTTSTP